MENTISWFPGHMQKTMRLIKEIIKEIDLIIEIVDARAVNSSGNDFLIKEISNNKIVLKIALKSDLAFESKDVLAGTIYEKSFRKNVIEHIKKAAKNKIESKIKKGYVNPKIYVIVVGLPNVGKSSFINFMANNYQLIASDMPGVTRKKQWLKVEDWIEMLDTPGVFHKKLTNFDELAILALIRTIKWQISPKHEIIEWAFNYFKKNLQTQFESFYKIEMTSFSEFLNTLCLQRKLMLKNDEKDFERAIEIIYKDISTGKICKINYDKKN